MVVYLAILLFVSCDLESVSIHFRILCRVSGCAHTHSCFVSGCVHWYSLVLRMVVIRMVAYNSFHWSLSYGHVSGRIRSQSLVLHVVVCLYTFVRDGLVIVEYIPIPWPCL